MAELIPLDYRVRIARKRLISRWTTVGIIAAGFAISGLTLAYHWSHQQSAKFADQERKFREGQVYVKAYADLKARRDDLAQRMKKMEDLQDDRVLLSLLHNVSTGFSDADALEYICIDAYPAEKKGAEPRYSVRVRGITADDSSYSRFLDRLTDIGNNRQTPLRVPLGEKHLLLMLDGQVTSFDITCDQPVAKGG
jgi:hypothetical protein